MYGKLFVQMYDGTLGTKGPWQALVTFQQLVMLADQHGDVDMTPEAIARRTTIPLEIITEGLQALEQPDPDSRSPLMEGRRIVRLNEDRDWGWHVVNHAHYRAIRSQDDRREYMKNYQRARRANEKLSTSGKQSQPIGEAEAEAKTELQTPLLAPSPEKRGLGAAGEPKIFIPLNSGEYGITDIQIEEFGRLYPAVDVPQTLNEIRGWNLTHPQRRKTRRGILSHINGWLAKEQNRGPQAG